MTNLTISIDEAVVRQARVRAIQEGTSVSAKVREFLASYAQGGQSQQSAAQAFIEAARSSQANTSGQTWSRDDAHDQPYPGRA
jgi:plasmid stability protein